MTAAALTTNCAVLLGKLIPRLGSDHAGEIIATVEAIKRALAHDGRDLHDLAKIVNAPTIVPEVKAQHHDFNCRAMAQWCSRYAANQLSGRETNFIQTMLRWRGEPTEPQAAWLLDIYDRLRGSSSG
jgi:hypothetical protein